MNRVNKPTPITELFVSKSTDIPVIDSSMQLSPSELTTTATLPVIGEVIYCGSASVTGSDKSVFTSVVITHFYAPSFFSFYRLHIPPLKPSPLVMRLWFQVEYLLKRV